MASILSRPQSVNISNMILLYSPEGNFTSSANGFSEILVWKLVLVFHIIIKYEACKVVNRFWINQLHQEHFWQRYSKFHIWHWKFKVKVMAKVKPNCHIWGLEFNRYVCFSFCGNQTPVYRGDVMNITYCSTQTKLLRSRELLYKSTALSPKLISP